MGSSRARALLLTVVCLVNCFLATAAKEGVTTEIRSTKDLKPGVVAQLTDTNFDVLVQKEIWLVDVYASW
jgi:hypothetical protein